MKQVLHFNFGAWFLITLTLLFSLHVKAKDAGTICFERPSVTLFPKGGALPGQSDQDIAEAHQQKYDGKISVQIGRNGTPVFLAETDKGSTLRISDLTKRQAVIVKDKANKELVALWVDFKKLGSDRATVRINTYGVWEVNPSKKACAYPEH